MQTFFAVAAGFVASSVQAQSFSHGELSYPPLRESNVAQVQPATDSRPRKAAKPSNTPDAVAPSGGRSPVVTATKDTKSTRQDLGAKYIARGCSSQEQALALCSADER